METASSNLQLKAEVAEKVFGAAERLAEVAEARTKELDAVEATLKRVSKELECYQRLEAALLAEGFVEEAVMRNLKWRVVQQSQR